MLSNPRPCKTGDAPCQPTDVTEALYCTVHHAPNGKTSEQIAREINRPLSWLLAAVDPMRGDRPFDVRVFAPVMNSAGVYAPLRVVAGEARHGIYLLPGLGASTTEINLRLLRVLQELGDVSVVLERVQADGRLDSDEGREALTQLRELLEAVVALQAAVAEASREAVNRPPVARMGLNAGVAKPARRRA